MRLSFFQGQASFHGAAFGVYMAADVGWHFLEHSYYLIHG